MSNETQHTQSLAGDELGQVTDRAPASGDQGDTALPGSAGEASIGRRAQIACLWAGLVMVVGLGVGLVTAGWVPPPVANESATQVAQAYVEHQDRIRVGILILFFTTPLGLPFCVVVAMHMRVRGRWSPWAFVHVGAAVFAAVPTLFAAFLWLTATYHPEARTASDLKLLHDAGWLNIVGTVAPTVLLCASVAAFVLSNGGHAFPRWVGYFNVWWALLVIPGLFVYCFDTGPLAWNGIFTFWLAGAWVLAWYTTMFVVLRRAILSSHQDAWT